MGRKGTYREVNNIFEVNLTYITFYFDTRFYYSSTALQYDLPVEPANEIVGHRRTLGRLKVSEIRLP